MQIGDYTDTVEIIPKEDPVPKPVGNEERIEVPMPVGDGDEEGVWAS